MVQTQKTPEINELESALKILKIWAHNFEKQKSYNTFSEHFQKSTGFLQNQ